MLAAVMAGAVQADTAERLYERLQERVYQIRLVDRSSDAETSVGSGFQITADGVLATNYHVVADKLAKPERYRLEYVDFRGERGTVEVIGVDVVRDLALVRGEVAADAPLSLGADEPAQGEALFTLGNPLDLGMSIVEGSYNGLETRSLYRKMMFSGALNAGMSGGPAVDRKGRVVGVNVARAGEDIGFLVPVDELRDLHERVRERGYEPPASFDAVIERQLEANQARYMKALLDEQWQTAELGGARVPGRIASFLECSGDTVSKERALHRESWKRCTSRDAIFLTRNLSTGSVAVYASAYSTDQLGPRRFYNVYQGEYHPHSFGGSEDEVTEFTCRSRLIATGGAPWKAAFCARGYRRFAALYDAYVSLASVGAGDRGVVVQAQLTGVTRDNARRFTDRLIETLRWIPSSSKP